LKKKLAEEEGLSGAMVDCRNSNMPDSRSSRMRRSCRRRSRKEERVEAEDEAEEACIEAEENVKKKKLKNEFVEE